METDREDILNYYFKGFTDQLLDRFQQVPNGIFHIAYNMGRNDALIGSENLRDITENQVFRKIINVSSRFTQDFE